jgi:hypothetical protein
VPPETPAVVAVDVVVCNAAAFPVVVNGIADVDVEVSADDVGIDDVAVDVGAEFVVDAGP